MRRAEQELLWDAPVKPSIQIWGGGYDVDGSTSILLGRGTFLVAQEATSRSAAHSSRRRRDTALCGGIGRFSTSTSSGSETKTLTSLLVRSRAKREISNDEQSSQKGSWHGWSLEVMSSSTSQLVLERLII